MAANLFVINIDKSQVERMFFDPDLLQLFNRTNYNKIILLFQGYDTDKREVHEIPEIKKWYHGLYKRRPHLYYNMNELGENIQIMLLCLYDKGEVVLRGAKRSAIEVGTWELNELGNDLVHAAIEFEPSKEHELVIRMANAFREASQ
jgi:hypothetical protein